MANRDEVAASVFAVADGLNDILPYGEHLPTGESVALTGDSATIRSLSIGTQIDFETQLVESAAS